MNIFDQFDITLRKKLADGTSTALLPVGSIEQHGPHLPISTDSDIIGAIAKRLETKTKCILLPTLVYGVSFEHSPFFNLSIKNSTLAMMLLDICNSLLQNNIKKIIILNGHHGNQNALRIFKNKSKLNVKIYSYWHYTSMTFDHAGLVETSLMLAISPSVKMNLAKPGLVTDKLSKQELSRLSKQASISFPSVTKNGVWGDPTGATKFRGKKLLTEITTNLANELNFD